MRRRVTVLVHQAQFFTDEGGLGGPPYHFIKVTNNGRRPCEITHVWIETENRGQQIPVLTRPLPHRLLGYGGQWETWISVRGAPLLLHRQVRRVRVRLSNGKTLRGRPNRDVPTAGFVAGVQ